METSESTARNVCDGVARSRSAARWRAASGWSTTVSRGCMARKLPSRPVPQPRRNVELKAVDRDPAATLARAQGAGAQDHGTLVQTDTYFGVRHGRLKL